MHLTNSLKSWGTPQFNDTLKQEVAELNIDVLPLQQGLTASSYVLDNARSVIVIIASEATHAIRAKVGIFYSGVLAGCSCADDPTPVEAVSEYCEVWLAINKTTAIPLRNWSRTKCVRC